MQTLPLGREKKFPYNLPAKFAWFLSTYVSLARLTELLSVSLI